MSKIKMTATQVNTENEDGSLNIDIAADDVALVFTGDDEGKLTGVKILHRETDDAYERNTIKLAHMLSALILHDGRWLKSTIEYVNGVMADDDDDEKEKMH